MPRKTKELDENKKIEETLVTKSSKTKKSSPKVASTKKASTKKEATKKATTKEKSVAKNKTVVKEKKTASKSPKSKETATNKEKKVTKKATTKASATKSSTKSTTTSKTKSTRRTKKVTPEVVEYYDLPLSYNQTVVKILYQTPTTLFVYWEIAEEDANNYRKMYGDNFFEITKPVLIIHNETLNYSFEIDINDFANSWYFNVNDSKSEYRVELIRKPITYNNKIQEPYIYISSSNTIEAPNDKILFEKYIPETVAFKNVKSNQKRYVSLKEIFKFTSFAKTFSNLYNIKIEDLYKAIYKNENTSDLYKLINPSSNRSSF